MSKRILLLLAVMILCMSVFVGCSGDDGKDGQGVTQEELDRIKDELREELSQGTVSVEASETCAICHGDGKMANYHTADRSFTTDVLSYNNVAVEQDGDDVVITFNIYENGQPFEGYTGFNAVYAARNWRDGETPTNATYAYERNRITSGGDLTQTAAGVYEIRFADAAHSTNANIKDLYDMVSGAQAFNSNVLVTFTYENAGLTTSEDPLREYYLVIYASQGTGLDRNLVSNEACANCHGADIFNRGNDSALELIAAKNDPSSGQRRGYHYATADNDVVDSCATCHGYNGNLAKYVHGIHSSSHSDPIVVKKDVARDYTYTYAIGYPNTMADCASCHDTQAALDEVLADEQFAYNTCMSCHQSWDSWDFTGTVQHATFTDATNCLNCHSESVAIAPTFKEFHNGYDAARYNGRNIAYEITNVEYNPETGKGSVSWRAYNTDTNANYNVLNENIKDAPVFRGDNNAAYRGGKSYATSFVFGFAGEGEDDWTNRGASSKSGQPALSVTVGAATTTVDSNNIATTTFTVPANARVNAKAIAGLQGVPLVGDYEYTVVNSTTKTFSLDGNNTELPRREIVDNAKCQSCHGAFVFHGNNRINEVQLCVVCHSPNATEKDGRTLLGGLNDDLVFVDGKSEESYDLRTMIHRIHTASAYTGNYTLYRSRAIYGFGKNVAEMAGWATPEKPINNAATGATIGWTDVEVYYPQAKSNCEACHKPGTYGSADAHAVPVTIKQGTEYKVNATGTSADAVDGYSDKVDVIVGPTQASCGSCHTSSSADTHMTSLGFKGKGNKAEIMSNK